MNPNKNEQMKKNSTLIEDVQKLLNKDAIKELVYEWDYLTDERVGSDQVIDKFCTYDVIYDAGPLGRTEGKEAFQDAVREIWDEELFFTRHMRHNPVINVNGDEAEGKWYADIPSITGDGKAVWIMGKYELGFRRVNGTWKISKYTFDFSYMTDYDKGWVKEPFIEGVPGELNWHLPLIGMGQAKQGSGYGSQLLQHTLDEIDGRGEIAYLENTNPVRGKLL